MAVKHDKMLSFRDLFQEDFAKEIGIKEFSVGDIVKFTPEFAFMKSKENYEFCVVCIVEYPHDREVGVVVGKKICGYWMIYGDIVEGYKPPADPNSIDWNFWKDGPATFALACLEKV